MIARNPLHAKARVGCETARRPLLDTAPDFGHGAAVAAEHDGFVALLDGLDELGEPRVLASCMLTLIILANQANMTKDVKRLSG